MPDGRSRRRLLPTMTPARLRWLERLAESPTIRRGADKHIPFDCMRLGWTTYSKRTLIDLYPREELTPYGRHILAQYRKEHPKP